MTPHGGRRQSRDAADVYFASARGGRRPLPLTRTDDARNRARFAPDGPRFFCRSERAREISVSGAKPIRLAKILLLTRVLSRSGKFFEGARFFAGRAV